MKKLLLLFFLLFSFNVSGQTLVDTGKVWIEEECLNFGPCSNYIHYFQGDTVIGSYQYKKLHNWMYPAYAREDSTKKVYFYFNNNEYLYYDFSLDSGDVFTSDVGGCFIYYSVYDTDTVYLLNGEPRKRFFMNFDTWIDGIGSINGLMSEFTLHCMSDVFPVLLCFYENDTLKYHNAGFDSCAFFGVHVQENIMEYGIKIYPNPSTLQVTISFSKYVSGDLQIFDLTGRVVHQQTLLNQQSTINIQQFSKGLYFVKVSDGKQSAVQKLIIE
jgi:hypothetical protein